MTKDMSRDPIDRERGPEDAFRGLQQRPTDELDSAALWRRVENELEPRATQGWFARAAALAGLDTAPGVPRLAAAAAAVVLMLGVIWLLPGQPVTDQVAPGAGSPTADAGLAGRPVESSELVPLVAAVDVGATGEATDRWQVDVRLVRGYDGAIPADAIPAAGMGAGGADALLDLRAALAGVNPFTEVALVGRWSGSVGGSDSPDRAVLSDRFELSFDAALAADGVALREVVLAGAGRPLVADELTLSPGRDYVFGVQAEGEADDVGSLFLAVRLVPMDPTPAAIGNSVPR